MRQTAVDALRAQHHRLLARLNAVRRQQQDAARFALDPATGSTVDVIADPLEREALHLMEADLVARLAELELHLEAGPIDVARIGRRRTGVGLADIA